MKYFIITVIALLAACQQPIAVQEEVPEETVAKIMAEIALADGAVNALNGVKRDSLVREYYNQVYKINGIDLETHEKYLRILATDTERLERVVNRAEQIIAEQLPPDSLKNKQKPAAQ